MRRASQPLFAPLLLAVVLTAVPRLHRTAVFLSAALVFATAGDTLAQFTPEFSRQVAAASFLAALACYCVALFPIWARHRDAMRIALAIPYGGVVIGLFVACADGASSLLPLVAVYAVALALMAFLSAGGNSLTWTGGTFFLLSSSLLAMEWFLPGASISYSSLLVMATYAVGQGLLVAGLLRSMPLRRWEKPSVHGAALVIVEN